MATYREKLPTQFPSWDTTTSNPTAGDEDYLNNLERQIWMYGSLPILAVGLVGNAFIIAIFSFSPNPKVRDTTTARFLSVMAVCDSLFLLSGLLVEWLEQCGFIVFNELNVYTCRTEKFVFYVSGDVSIWILCAFSFDRAFAVSRPFLKQRFSKKKYATWCVIAMIIVAVVKNMHVFWTRGEEYAPSTSTRDASSMTGEGRFDVYANAATDGVTEVNFTSGSAKTERSLSFIVDTRCGRPSQYENFENRVRPWIAFTLVNALPFVFISVCNFVIIYTLVKNDRPAMTSSEKGLRQTISMCLGVSFAFLICITPSMVLYIGRPSWTQTQRSTQIYDVIKAVSNLLAYLNHAVNFFLYCITGQLFREEFSYLLWKTREDPRKRSVAYSCVTGRKSNTTTTMDRQISHPSTTN